MLHIRFLILFFLTLAFQAACVHRLASAEPGPGAPFEETAPLESDATSQPRQGDAARGYDRLVTQAFLPGDFDRETFDRLWESWPEPLRSQAAQATLSQRRWMAFDRYGLTPRDPELAKERSVTDPGDPLQYVVDSSGKWTMNCFSCHGGSVYGMPTPGSPNNRFALQTLTEEIRWTKFRNGVGFGRMEMGSLLIPLGTTHGTTNAVVFGMGLMHYRDEQLNLVDRPPISFTHHDMDAPPWWTFYKRPYLYIDGFAEKGHRGLMQFTLVPENDARFYREHEDDFRDVYAYLSSLRPPKYPGPIDDKLARAGRSLFEANCSECHGTYGRNDEYPNRMVAIDEIGTDPVRHEALSVAGRKLYAKSWFAHAGEEDEQATIVAPEGYVAPPLDGIWASAPYFHNGSVPTLHAVLHPDDRPAIWQRTNDDCDDEKVGLTVRVLDQPLLEHPDVAVRRSVFDTRRFGKSNSGHDYPERLDEDEKRAVLEYLKTL
ncbi:MAG: hypothetical protein AAGD07_12000 [Planctomycetota bacterium]